MDAKASYRERSRSDRRRVKRFKSPNTDRMPGIKVPDSNIPGKYTYFFFRTKKRRDEAFKQYDNAVKINPK